MAVADDPLDVAVEALMLVDLLAATLPVGGGMAIRSRALPYAEAVVSALAAYPKENPIMSDPALDRPEPVPVDPYVAARDTAARSLTEVRNEIDVLVDQRAALNDRVRRLRAEEAVLSSAMRAFDRIEAEPAPAPGSVRPSDDLDDEDAAVDGLAVPVADQPAEGDS